MCIRDSFYPASLSVCQQEVLPLHRKDDEELSLVPASIGTNNV